MDYAVEMTGDIQDASPPADVTDLVGGILAAEIADQRANLLLKA